MPIKRSSSHASQVYHSIFLEGHVRTFQDIRGHCWTFGDISGHSVTFQHQFSVTKLEFIITQRVQVHGGSNWSKQIHIVRRLFTCISYHLSGGTWWDILDFRGTFWNSMRHLRTLWDITGHLGTSPARWTEVDTFRICCELFRNEAGSPPFRATFAAALIKSTGKNDRQHDCYRSFSSDGFFTFLLTGGDLFQFTATLSLSPITS